MKNLLVKSALILVMAGMISCKCTKGVAQTTEVLTSTKWELAKVNGTAVQASNYGNGVPTATFAKEDNRISGSGGCNNYNGTYTLGEDGSLKIGPVMATKMACLNGGNGETEYFRTLEQVTKTKVSKDKVVLLNGNKEVLEFKPAL
jgi:heat shock protein HslJ